MKERHLPFMPLGRMVIKKPIVAVLVLWIASLFQTMALAQERPNIIFILVDDLGYGDLGVFFQNERKAAGDRSEPWIMTPQLDAMAREGAMLTDHYTAAPVCAPSRASILMGVSQGHAHVRDNQFDKEIGDNFTMADMLGAAGYETIAIGKWGLQGEGEGPAWPTHPLKKGFDHYYGYIRHRDGHEHYPVEGVYRGEKEVYDGYEIVKGLDKCYTGDLFTAKAKAYIIQHQERGADRPFFMYLAYDTPHAVLELPTQDYPAGAGLKGGLQWLGTPGEMINTASGDVDSFVYPAFDTATYDHDREATTPEVAWPDTYKRYATVNRRIDDQVGDLIQLLKDLHIDENTLVVFTSDNGPSRESYLPSEYVEYTPEFFNNFAHFDGIKRDVYEGGLRTATIAFWPGHIGKGTIINEPSISYDWMPTFAEAAGTMAPVRTDGVSLLPSLTGKGKQQPSQIYVEYFMNGKIPEYAEFTPAHQGKKRGQMQMIRMGDHVGVRYDIQGHGDDFEIYNVQDDPQQAKDLAPSLPELQTRFKQDVLRRRMADADAPRPYDRELVPALPIKKASPGLRVLTYQNPLPYIPQVTQKPIAKEKRPSFDVNSSSAKGNLQVVEAYIKIPANGKYTFSVNKGDGLVFMRIHDMAVLNGHDQAFSTLQGEAYLEAGYHPVKLYYQPGKDTPTLNLYWQSEGQQPAEVPAAAWYR